MISMEAGQPVKLVMAENKPGVVSIGIVRGSEIHFIMMNLYVPEAGRVMRAIIDGKINVACLQAVHIEPYEREKA
jgi:hypothetical protein